MLNKCDEEIHSLFYTCLAVKPFDRENSDPFSTSYAPPQTLHFKASDDSAYY